EPLRLARRDSDDGKRAAVGARHRRLAEPYPPGCRPELLECFPLDLGRATRPRSRTARRTPPTSSRRREGLILFRGSSNRRQSGIGSRASLVVLRLAKPEARLPMAACRSKITRTGMKDLSGSWRGPSPTYR